MAVTKVNPFPKNEADQKAVVVAAGHRLEIFNFKATKKQPVKRDSEAWILPNLYQGELVSNKGQMMAEMIATVQNNLVRTYIVEGAVDCLTIADDLDKVAEDYLKDNRGNRTGVKQDDLLDWIAEDLAAAMMLRMEGNKGMTDEQKKNLCSGLVGQFEIAASRNNMIVKKDGGIKKLTMPAIKDLQQRLSILAEAGLLDNEAPEFGAIVTKLANHAKVIEEAKAEEVLGEF